VSSGSEVELCKWTDRQTDVTSPIYVHFMHKEHVTSGEGLSIIDSAYYINKGSFCPRSKHVNHIREEICSSLDGQLKLYYNSLYTAVFYNLLRYLLRTCFQFYNPIFRSSLLNYVTTLNAVHIIITPYVYYTFKLQFCDIYFKLVSCMSSSWLYWTLCIIHMHNLSIPLVYVSKNCMYVALKY
jgi:hypothetical protein